MIPLRSFRSGIVILIARAVVLNANAVTSLGAIVGTVHSKDNYYRFDYFGFIYNDDIGYLLWIAH